MDAKKSRKPVNKPASGVRADRFAKPLLHEEVLAMIGNGTKEERGAALRNAGIMTKSGKLSARYKR